jgi:DNA topoisomerase-1
LETAQGVTDVDLAMCAAEEAGLRYVTDTKPGITRRRSGKGWSYRKTDGSPVSPADKKRIDALVIPPAWTKVWICPYANGHVQATGRDERGRKQYRYHARWRETRDATKYEQLGLFGAGLGDLRRRLESDLALRGMPREKALALVVTLLDRTLIRVGNDEYAQTNDSYGLTTLRSHQVEIDGKRLAFDFNGKSGVRAKIALDDRRLARLVNSCHELGGAELFAYVDGDRVVDVGSSDVNAYLRETTGQAFTAKHFRTWGGTCAAAGALVLSNPPASDTEATKQVLAAMDVAACVLHNTRAVCRSCYVHPIVPEAFADGGLHERWRLARAGGGLARIERTMVNVLSDASPLALAG